MTPVASKAPKEALLPALLRGRGLARLVSNSDEPLVGLLLDALLARLRELPAREQTESVVPAAGEDRSSLRPALSVTEAAAELGISRALAYDLVRQGEIPSVRLGRRLIVPRIAVERLLSGESTRARELFPTSASGALTTARRA